MKKNHSPGGARICLRMLCYSLAFIAVIGTRETLTEGTGPVSRQLCSMINGSLMTGSKLALGFALMTHDKKNVATFSGWANRTLGRAAYRGFVSASKVDMYGQNPNQ